MNDSHFDNIDQEAAPQRYERAFNIPTVILLISAILLGIELVRAYVLSPDQDIELLLRAAFIPIRYTGGYELDIYAFTSPITYALLHGGFEHLIVNLVWLVAFGSPLAQRLGAMRFLIFSIAATLSAVLLHFVLHSYDQSPLIGASGAVAGMMGAATRFAFRIDRSEGMPGFAGPILPIRQVLQQRTVLIFLLVWMAANAITGIYSLTPGGGGIAWEAHVGGFLLGFFGIALFDPPGAANANLEIRADTAHDRSQLDQPDDSAGRKSQ